MKVMIMQFPAQYLNVHSYFILCKIWSRESCLRKARCGGLQLVVCAKYEAGIRCPRDFVICAKSWSRWRNVYWRRFVVCAKPHAGVSFSAQSLKRGFVVCANPDAGVSLFAQSFKGSKPEAEVRFPRESLSGVSLSDQRMKQDFSCPLKTGTRAASQFYSVTSLFKLESWLNQTFNAQRLGRVACILMGNSATAQRKWGADPTEN